MVERFSLAETEGPNNFSCEGWRLFEGPHFLIQLDEKTSHSRILYRTRTINDISHGLEVQSTSFSRKDIHEKSLEISWSIDRKSNKTRFIEGKIFCDITNVCMYRSANIDWGHYLVATYMQLPRFGWRSNHNGMDRRYRDPHLQKGDNLGLLQLRRQEALSETLSRHQLPIVNDFLGQY